MRTDVHTWNSTPNKNQSAARLVVATKNRGNIRHLGGGVRQLATDSARLHSSKTPQSTSDRLGGGGIVQVRSGCVLWCASWELWPAGFLVYKPRLLLDIFTFTDDARLAAASVAGVISVSAEGGEGSTCLGWATNRKFNVPIH